MVVVIVRGLWDGKENYRFQPNKCLLCLFIAIAVKNDYN